MEEDDLENFFDALITEKNERKILKLISKGVNEDEILETLLNGGNGDDKP